MAYVPVALERDAWLQIETLKSFDTRAITRGRMTPTQTVNCINRWLADGAIEQIGKADGGHRLYRVTPGYVRAPAPSGRTPEENMWAAIRGLPTFTPTDVAAHATTEAVSVPLAKSREYIRNLLAAGYLRIQRKAAGNVEARYSLVRRTGPRPPLVRRILVIEDQNNGDIHHLYGGAK